MGSVDDIQSLRTELAKKEHELQEQLKLNQQLWDEKRSLESKIDSLERDCEYWKEVSRQQMLAHEVFFDFIIVVSV